MELFDIAGRKAIVTGASRGLGQGIAEAFMEAGVEVVLWATKPISESVTDKYLQKGYCFHDIGVDIGCAAYRKSAFADSVNMLGGHLDILVNAAGIQRRHKAEEFPASDWEDVLSINLTAAFSLCQLAGELMLRQGRGKIINIASLLSYFGGYTIPAYAASKGGIVQVTKALANEWAAHGVNVNAVAPGYMVTEMNTALLNDIERYESILARIPAKRWGTAEDLKGISIFLASSASDYLHGAVIPVDGGYMGC